MFVENSCTQKELLPLLGGKFCGSKILTGFNFISRGTKIDPDTFGKTELDELVQNGQFLGYLSFDQGEDNNAEPSYSETTQNKRVQKIRGRKGWITTFEKSVCFDNQIDKLNNSQSWAVIPVLEDGSAVFKKNTDGTIEGFDCRLFHSIYNLPLTADVTGSMLEIDLEETADWQALKGLYAPDDFSFREIEPVAGVSIEIDETTLVAGTTVEADVNYLCSSDAIVGIEDDLSIWLAIVNGAGVAINAITVAVEDPTKFTFTLATPLVASDEVSIELNDGINTIVPIDTAYVSGSSQTATVA